MKGARTRSILNDESNEKDNSKASSAVLKYFQNLLASIPIEETKAKPKRGAKRTFENSELSVSESQSSSKGIVSSEISSSTDQTSGYSDGNASPYPSKKVRISRVSSAVRTFACTDEGCDKTFSQLAHLKIHQRKHTGERPYSCTFSECGRSFAQVGNLRIHERCHTGERPYQCTFAGCEKAFSQLGNMKTHLKLHQNGGYKRTRASKQKHQKEEQKEEVPPLMESSPESEQMPDTEIPEMLDTEIPEIPTMVNEFEDLQEKETKIVVALVLSTPVEPMEFEYELDLMRRMKRVIRRKSYH